MPGVNFTKVGRTGQIIDITLSICTLRLCPTFEKLFTGIKVWRKGVGCKKVNEIDPWWNRMDIHPLLYGSEGSTHIQSAYICNLHTSEKRAPTWPIGALLIWVTELMLVNGTTSMSKSVLRFVSGIRTYTSYLDFYKLFCYPFIVRPFSLVKSCS